MDRLTTSRYNTVFSTSEVTMTLSGITPREHTLRLCQGIHKQTRWPFKAMILGDYFVVRSKEDAKRINSALSTFYKSRNGAGRRFTVTQSEGPVWTCRRTA